MITVENFKDKDTHYCFPHFWITVNGSGIVEALILFLLCSTHIKKKWSKKCHPGEFISVVLYISSTGIVLKDGDEENSRGVDFFLHLNNRKLCPGKNCNEGKTRKIWILTLQFNSIQPKSTRSRRAIDLSQEKKLISESRLPQDLVPNSYKLDLHPNFQDNTFHGRVLINATVLKWTNEIQLHSQVDMQIDTQDVLVRRTNSEA